MLKLLILVISVVSFYSFGLPVLATEPEDYRATYSSVEGKLYIPYVLFPVPGSPSYEVEMQQLPIADPLQFVVTKLSEKEANTEAAETEVEFTIVAQDEQFYGYQPGGRAEEPLFTVIREEKQLIPLWDNDLTAGMEKWDKPPKPKIDFHQEMLIVLLLGVQLAGQYTFRVDQLTETNDFLNVRVDLERLPSHPTDSATLIQPYQLLKLKQSSKLVTFNFHSVDHSDPNVNTEALLFREKQAYERIKTPVYQTLRKTPAEKTILVSIWAAVKLEPIQENQFASHEAVKHSQVYQDNLQKLRNAQTHLCGLFQDRLQIDAQLEADGSLPVIKLALTPKQILTISYWEEVASIFLFRETTINDDRVIMDRSMTALANY